MTSEEKTLEALDEMKRWLRILALPVLRQSLQAELATPELQVIYEETDGRQIRDVAKSAGAGFGTVQRHWQEWAAKGLVEPAGRQGRFRKIISLRELGMGVPTAKKRKTKKASR